jgi:protein involved in polysaccharide export with SLBB domain
VLRIAVLGEVIQPGLIPVDPTFTLADIVASAGGLTPSADRGDIALVRDGQRVLTTSIEELALARAAVLSGDQVFVGRRSWVSENIPILVGGGVSVIATLITALILR